jgi:hypothetical protein
MGKILVKSPSAAAPLAASGLGNVVQDAFKVTTPFGRGVGGALGGLTALTSLADASENQQDFLSGAQMAAGRGVGAYIGAGKAADAAAPVANQVYDKAGQVAARYDPRASQQVGVQASRGQVQRFKERDFGAGLPEDFQLGVLGTSMGGGNYVAPGKQGIQPNLFSGKPTTMNTTNVTAPPTNLSYQVPTAQTMAANEPTPPRESTRLSTPTPPNPIPSAPTTSVIPDASEMMTAPSTVDATAQMFESMSPEQKVLYQQQHGGSIENGEPMELAFRLLKSVMR